MSVSYRTILYYGQDEIIINKSRFIGYAKPVETEEEALEFIESIKRQHRDATHNVYAYTIGLDGNIQRFNDDGEPSGTAGIPMLEVIKKENLRNVVVVVTRYFGGIKLGGGGLIRAYTRGAKIGLEAGRIVEMVLHTRLSFKIDYGLYGKFENYLMTNNYTLEDTIYGENVDITLFIKNEDLESFQKTLIDLANGAITISLYEESYRPILEASQAEDNDI